ncbi:MAG: Gfo/Idh/MocA family oxidoreductase [Armatimonadetes bacterium]|nr:Gfo/Idh/MocA family oxidoreductase [Armatimonadota bacterium]
MRFHPLVVKMKQMLDERALGDPFQLSIWTEQYTRFPADHWASSAAKLGGGQLFSHGCHYIDLLLWFLGRPVRGSHLGSNYCTPWMEMEGTSNVQIQFADGPLGYHFGTWGAKGTRLRYSFQAHGTEGMLDARVSQGQLYSIVGGEEKLIFEAPLGKHTENEMRHFLDCVETGATPLTDGPGSVQGLKVIWRMYEAEQQGVVADLRGCGLDEYAPA